MGKGRIHHKGMATFNIGTGTIEIRYMAMLAVSFTNMSGCTAIWTNNFKNSHIDMAPLFKARTAGQKISLELTRFYIVSYVCNWYQW
ncbi:hypothetical protein PL78_16280 [Yersinia entomophaga]|uniref:Uncharacterized protein n=2 Tax=Yersinia TaxID=629 RepID=A0ABN4PWY7_YERET|nr:hypothetical protein PL78_16280 [Yersinia entomophaga]CBX70581.1 unknown protein [Yersinia enterocolitica W22703]